MTLMGRVLLALFCALSAAPARSDDGPGIDAFNRPRAGLDPAEIRQFALGRRLFNADWVAGPTPLTALDGLGPYFDEASCSACHRRNARPGARPDDLLPSGLHRSLVVRLDARLIPSLGGQLSRNAIPGIEPEGRLPVEWHETPGQFADGTPFSLRRPVVPDEMPSLRIGPGLIGLGLLAAVPEADILALADPGDADGDGISGRPNRIGPDGPLGRFGWKAAEPDLLSQVAGAASADMGLTSPLLPTPTCALAQDACRAAAGDAIDIDLEQLAALAFHVGNTALPPPLPRGALAVRGSALFAGLGCAACHTPLLALDVPVHSDLLLHDMGDGLADGRPEGDAGGREWRTAPLWGIGRAAAVNGPPLFLHDGRARTLDEAILWHGGEAVPARDRFIRLDGADRAALIAYLTAL